MYVLAGDNNHAGSSGHRWTVVEDKNIHRKCTNALDKHREHYYYWPKNGQKRRDYYFLHCRATVWRYVIFLRICIEYYTRSNRFEMHTAKNNNTNKNVQRVLHSTCIYTYIIFDIPFMFLYIFQLRPDRL